MNPQSSSPLPWYRWLSNGQVIRLLETVQDFIVICLCIGLFSCMILQLRAMLLSLLPPLDFQPVTSDILFLLILVELFRLLIIYLQEHRVSIGVAVEVSIVSVLREVIVRGVLETPWLQVLVACIFLMVLGGLLVIRVWLPPTFDGIDPEQVVSRRHRSRFGSQPASALATAPLEAGSDLGLEAAPEVRPEARPEVRPEAGGLRGRGMDLYPDYPDHVRLPR